jgi:hypothetical protein
VTCAWDGSPGPQITVGTPPKAGVSTEASVKNVIVSGSRADVPVTSATASATEAAHSWCGSVHTGGRSTSGARVTDGPAHAARPARTVAWSWPATVRTSTVASARSGTELVLRPAWKVATFKVGAPMTGCGWSGNR